MALWFNVKDEMRYLSHRDTLRLLGRALARARIPVRYSQGFNPHMRMSLPLPRSVGMSSQAELLVVELQEPYSPERIYGALSDQLPTGISLRGVKAIAAHEAAHPVWARYQITLGGKVDRAAVDRRLVNFHRSNSWRVHRPGQGRHPAKDVDLKTSVTELHRQEDNLVCVIDVKGSPVARVEELLAALEINKAGQVKEIRRTEVGYSQELDGDD